MATWREHLAISHRFREQGLAEVESGDLLQGSEKLWGAAAHAVKAAAEQRSWKHNGHYYLFKVINELVLVTGDSRFKEAFDAANRLHVNFYEDTLDSDKIDKEAQIVLDLIDMINAIVLD